MANNLFFISDTHFGHENIIKFQPEHRPWKTIQEHDEALINNWNKTVRPDDKVFHCGDVLFSKFAPEKLNRLNGRKTLILGNHDRFDRIGIYFAKVYGLLEFDRGLLSHIPVHTNQLDARFTFNIHGHLHAHTLDDERYINVSCEQINCTPIAWEDLKKKHSI